jgi:hypothetical protein
MPEEINYSQYQCPYAHLEKECGHELHGPEGPEYSDRVWCACGFRGPTFYFNPESLGLQKITTPPPMGKCSNCGAFPSFDLFNGKGPFEKILCQTCINLTFENIVKALDEEIMPEKAEPQKECWGCDAKITDSRAQASGLCENCLEKGYEVIQVKDGEEYER